MTKKPRPKGETHVERVGRRPGGARSELPESEQLTADEMLDWLRRETAAVSKEAELRIREATGIATDFARGRISKEEANMRLFRYDERWPDALEGIYNAEKKTDEQILSEVDAASRRRRSQGII